MDKINYIPSFTNRYISIFHVIIMFYIITMLRKNLTSNWFVLFTSSKHGSNVKVEEILITLLCVVFAPGILVLVNISIWALVSR